MLSYDVDESLLDGLMPDHFAYYGHQVLYAGIQKELNRNKGSITPHGVIEELRARGSLLTAGGEGYIYEIIEEQSVPTTTIPEAVKHVKKYNLLRKIEESARLTLRAVEGAEVDLATAEQTTRTLLQSLESRTEQKSLATTALEGIIMKAEDTFRPAVTTGWPVLDNYVRLSPGRLVVLGARPGMGKTTLATQLSAQILKYNPESHVLYCTVEMDAAEIGLKAISALTTTDCVTPYQTGNKEGIAEVKWRAGHQSHILDRLHIFYGTRLDKLVNLANQMYKKFPVKLVICDFISSMTPPGTHGTRTEAIGYVSKALKQLARDLQIPVLACSQLNRGTVGNRRPTMKDLRDSGEIEQDADIVMLLHQEDTEDDPNRSLLIIEKNRFGTLNDLPLRTQFQFHRFSF